MKEGVLPKDSMNYYEYKANKVNSTISIQLADNNKNCAIMYLSMEDFPSERNNLVK